MAYRIPKLLTHLWTHRINYIASYSLCIQNILGTIAELFWENSPSILYILIFTWSHRHVCDRTPNWGQISGDNSEKCVNLWSWNIAFKIKVKRSTFRLVYIIFPYAWLHLSEIDHTGLFKRFHAITQTGISSKGGRRLCLTGTSDIM